MCALSFTSGTSGTFLLRPPALGVRTQHRRVSFSVPKHGRTFHHRCRSSANVTCMVSGRTSTNTNTSSTERTRVRQLILSFAVVSSAVANRIAYRMQLSGSMASYTFFIAQTATICYSLIYWFILFSRIRHKVVSKKQLVRARSLSNLRIFAAIGTLEAITSLIQLYAAARLPGTVIAILSQTLLPATMIISASAFGRRYSTQQILGAILVIAGVLICTLPTAVGGSFQLSVAFLYGFAYLFLALAITLKERQLQSGHTFDVFIVTSFSSIFQCLATFALFPVSAAFVTSLPAIQYLNNGLTTFFTAPYMPWLTFLYITCNVFFNIAALTLAKQTSATTVVMTNLFSVPLISFVFCLKLPLLTPAPFSWFICAALGIIIFGVFLYSSSAKRVAVVKSQ